MGTFNKEELEEIIRKGWIIHDLRNIEYSDAFMSVDHMKKKMCYDPVKKWVKDTPSNRGVTRIRRNGQTALMGNLVYFDMDRKSSGSIYFFSMYLKDEAPFWEMKGFYTAESHPNRKRSKFACYVIKNDVPMESTPEELVDFVSMTYFDFTAQTQIANKMVVKEMDGMMLDALLVCLGDEAKLKGMGVHEKENRLIWKLDGNQIKRKHHMLNLIEVFSRFLNTEKNTIGMLMEAFSFASWHTALADLIEKKSLFILKEEDVHKLELSQFLTHLPTGELDEVDLLTIEKMFYLLMKRKTKVEIMIFADSIMRIKRDDKSVFSKAIHDIYSMEVDTENKEKTAMSEK